MRPGVCFVRGMEQTMGRVPAKVRSLLPREHGAWAELILPLVAALAMARPTPAALAFACSACAAFLAHEPWLVLRGQRGSRARREDGERAARRLLTLMAVCGLTGGIALALTGVVGIEASLLPLGLSIALGVLVHRGQERTLLGETVAAAALASLALPVAIADGVSPVRALAAVAVWTAVFGLGTAVVRGLVAGAGQRLALLPTAVFLGSAVLYLSGTIALAPFVAVIPMCLLTGGVALARVRPQRLRPVGWAIAAACSVSAVALAFG